MRNKLQIKITPKSRGRALVRTLLVVEASLALRKLLVNLVSLRRIPARRFK